MMQSMQCSRRYLVAPLLAAVLVVAGAFLDTAAAQPAQLPRTGEGSFDLTGLVGLGAILLLIGLGVLVRRGL
jgi:LPXTG-motif cell wall-anchored protein